jgi:hypothetical protein
VKTAPTTTPRPSSGSMERLLMVVCSAALIASFWITDSLIGNRHGCIDISGFRTTVSHHSWPFSSTQPTTTTTKPADFQAKYNQLLATPDSRTRQPALGQPSWLPRSKLLHKIAAQCPNKLYGGLTDNPKMTGGEKYRFWQGCLSVWEAFVSGVLSLPSFLPPGIS